MSSEILSKSFTCGFLTTACTIPVKIPTESNGLNVPIGAVINAVMIAKGCPKANKVNNAARLEFHNNKFVNWDNPFWNPFMKLSANKIISKLWKTYSIALSIFLFSGTSFNFSKSKGL